MSKVMGEVEIYLELDNLASFIDDSDFRAKVIDTIHCLPTGCWRLPSAVYHHLDDEKGVWGNALHTIRVTKIALVLANSYSLKGSDKDYLIASSLFHDIGKHGKKGLSMGILPEHPFIVGDILRDTNFEDDRLVGIIRLHMGRWTPSLSPDEWLKNGKVTELLHLADCIEANLPNYLLDVVIE